MRKFYVEGHTSGDAVRIAAEASGYAARTPDTVVELHDGLSVTVRGEVSAEQVAAFAAHGAALGEDGRFSGLRAA